MAFCKINGVTLPVKKDDADDSPSLVQNEQRMEDASLFVDRRAEKGTWRVSVTPQDAAHAHAFRKLIHGEGHYWGFDATPPGVYSSRGLPPQAQNGGALATDQSWLGGGSLKFLFSDTGRNISFDALPANTPNGWTVMFAARESGGGVWDHWLATSTLGMSGSNWYKNGVFGFGIAPYSAGISGSVGRVTLQGDVNTTWFDELIILPYPVPSDWVSQIYDFQNPGSGNTQWGKLRKLKLSGDIVDDGLTKNVYARVSNSRIIHTKTSGVKTPKRCIEVEMVEV